MAEARFRPSEKGTRVRGRQPHRRGWRPGERLQSENVWVLLVAERAGELRPLYAGAVIPIVAGVGERPPRAGELEAALAPLLRRPSVLVSPQGRFGPHRHFCRTHGHEFRSTRHPRDGPGGEAVDGRVLIRAREFRDRMKGWIARFRGVATHYLPRYLLWHRHVDRIERESAEDEAARALVVAAWRNGFLYWIGLPRHTNSSR